MVTIAPVSPFASLLREYRLRAKLSQQELSDVLRTQDGITLYGSDISKLEQDRRKPPKVEVALAVIQALHLSEEEARHFLEAGDYPPSVFRLLSEQSREQRTSGDSPLPYYPPTTQKQGEAYLTSPLPSWQLSSEGCIVTCNRLAMWLFLATREEDIAFKPMFEVITKPWNLARILMTGKSNDFWLTKLQVLRWLEKYHPSEALERVKCIILENTTLRILYENLDKLNLDTISFHNYTLYIQHPETHHHYLHFHVRIWITRDQTGELDRFIVLYEPHDTYTRDVIAQKYEEVGSDPKNYVVPSGQWQNSLQQRLSEIVSCEASDLRHT